MEHDLGLGEQTGTGEGQQPGIAGTGTDQGNPGSIPPFPLPGHEVTIPAPTVAFVTGSMMMKLPIVRFTS